MSQDGTGVDGGEGGVMASESPTCHLPDLHHHKVERRQAAAHAIHEGWRRFGLVYVSGHDILADGLEEFYKDFVEVTVGEEVVRLVPFAAIAAVSSRE